MNSKHRVKTPLIQIATFRKLLSRLVAVFLLLTSLSQYGITQPRHSESYSQQLTQSGRSNESDQAFLEDLSRRSFQYFWEQADPHTGLVPDRARTDGSPLEESHRDVASVAATGFGLTALCIAAERKWITSEQARERVRSALRFFSYKAFHKKGWFYHWMDAKTGDRRWKSEVSSIDTALLLGGILTARQYFRNDR